MLSRSLPGASGEDGGKTALGWGEALKLALRGLWLALGGSFSLAELQENARFSSATVAVATNQPAGRLLQ